MKAKTTKIPLFTLLYSFFAKRTCRSNITENQSKEVQPLDLYAKYKQLYLNPHSTIRSRAKDLNISRYKSEELTKKLKNIQRNKRI